MCQGTFRGRHGIVNGQLDMCRLIYMNVLSTIDVDSLTTGWAHNEVTRIKTHSLSLTVRVITLDSFLNKHSGSFESVNEFFFVFLLNLREGFNPLSPLLFQKNVLGVSYLNKLLS